ncbi:MAG: type II toxin-antitoxin system RelE/ParE family toxin [Acidobacteriota bacterium]|nr:type II toxin-antitoxin system RelE/ParE family toxin [Acidobacteriota bacterium]
MAYKVLWHESAVSDLKTLDRQIAGKIVERIKTHLVQQPDKLSKPLKGVLQGLFRYRFGDYRIVFSIDRKEGRVSILHVAHRSEVYRVREGESEPAADSD